MENTTEILKGLLEGCVLEIIKRNDSYGYEITRKLHAMGFTDVVEGTVYTILVRLEKRKLVNTRKVLSDLGPPRKLYFLNANGLHEVEQFWNRWDYISSRINAFKEGKENE